MLRQALEEIEKEKILGVVLNGVEMQKYKYYQRYYGEYYHKKFRVNILYAADAVVP
jgi:Mrp family chromosome partitioning ATPase